MKKALFGFGLLVVCLAQAATKIDNTATLRRSYGLTPTFDRTQLDRVRVAVIDQGFKGLYDRITDERTQQQSLVMKSDTLPESAVLVEDFSPYFGDTCKPGKSDGFADHAHGKSMAQIVWAMTGNNPSGPEFYLLNGNGLKSFRCAVQFAREIAKVDIILFSQNFEYGGNFDGKGFINSIVNQATADGIIWVNAAGNYGGRVYNGPAPQDTKILRLRSNVTDNTVNITLAWSRVSDDQSIGTDLDYDLEIIDSMGKKLKVTNYKQVRAKTAATVVPPPPTPELELAPEIPKDLQLPATPEELPLPSIDAKPQETSILKKMAATPASMKQTPTPADPFADSTPAATPAVNSVMVRNSQVASRQEDLHPFETFSVELDRNDPANANDTYQLRIVRRGGSVNESDYVRVTVMSPEDRQPFANAQGQIIRPIEFLDATTGREIMVPADNPNVITVGGLEQWASQGPTMDGRSKPEITMADSTVQLSSGFSEYGTSQAAAILAGIVVQLKAEVPLLKRQDIIRFVKAETQYGVDRYATQGSLPNDARPTTLDVVRNANPLFDGIIKDLETKIVPSLVFEPYVTSEGNFILGMNRSPATILTNFPMQQLSGKLNQYEYYLTAQASQNGSDNQVIWALGDKATYTPANLRRPKPWEAFKDSYGNLTYKRSDFIELREVNYTEVRRANRTVKNMWKTPTLQQMKQAIADRL